MASTNRAVAAFLDLAETSLSPRGTVSHTQLTKEQIEEQAAAALHERGARVICGWVARIGMHIDDTKA